MEIPRRAAAFRRRELLDVAQQDDLAMQGLEFGERARQQLRAPLSVEHPFGIIVGTRRAPVLLQRDGIVTVLLEETQNRGL